MRRPIVCFSLVLGLAWATGASAAEPDNVSKAREIALAAAEDLEGSRFTEALEKVSRAEELYHAPTHLLMKAEALEGLGRLAEALETYETLAAEPLGAAAPPAFRKAREEGNKKQKALLARVPSVLVEVTGAPVDDVNVTIDGKKIALGAGVATRLDPGKHALVIEAKGFTKVEKELELAERGGVVKVPVHLAAGTETPAKDEPPPPKNDASDRGSQRTLVVPMLVSFGVGAASLAAGAVTGILSLSRVGDLEARCAADGRCPPDAQQTIDQAGLFGNVSTATFVVGGAAVAAGVTLLIVGRPKRASTAAKFEPWVGLGAAGLRGSF